MNLAFQAAAAPGGGAFHAFISTASSPLKCIIRRNMGERQALLIRQLGGTYFAIALIVLTQIGLHLLEGLISVSDVTSRNVFDTQPARPPFLLSFIHDGAFAYQLLIAFFALSWLCFFLRHREAEKRIAKGVRWHSQYIGESVLLTRLGRRSPKPPEQSDAFMIFGEPAVIAFAGLIISLILSTPLGIYLMISAAALSMDYATILTADRNQFLDAIDAAIMSAQLRAALVEGRPPSETEGFTVPSGLPMMTTIGERETLAEVIERTNPALRAMLDPLPATEDAIGPGPTDPAPGVMMLDPLPTNQGPASPLS